MTSIQGLKKALTLHTAHGDVTVDPAQDPLAYDQLLGESRDQRVAEDRQQQALANPDPLALGRNPILEKFNQTQQDAAMGPAGFNRQWASLLEAPNVIAENNPGVKVQTNYGSLDSRLAGLSGRKVRGV